MRAWLKGIFNALFHPIGYPANPSEPCSACLVYQAQVADLQYERDQMREALLKAVRLTPQEHVGRAPEAAHTTQTQQARDWPRRQAQLERQYMRKEGDEREAYWKRKAEEMEQLVPEMHAQMAGQNADVAVDTAELES